MEASWVQTIGELLSEWVEMNHTVNDRVIEGTNSVIAAWRHGCLNIAHIHG